MQRRKFLARFGALAATVPLLGMKVSKREATDDEDKATIIISPPRGKLVVVDPWEEVKDSYPDAATALPHCGNDDLMVFLYRGYRASGPYGTPGVNLTRGPKRRRKKR